VTGRVELSNQILYFVCPSFIKGFLRGEEGGRWSKYIRRRRAEGVEKEGESGRERPRNAQKGEREGRDSK